MHCQEQRKRSELARRAFERSTSTPQPNMTQAGFGWLLEHFRAKAGLSIAELSRKVNCDASLVSRFEKGERVPSIDMVERLSQLLGADRLLIDAYHRVSWYQEGEIHPKWFRVYAGRERLAVEVLKYSIALVPGPGQHRDYAEALFRRGEVDPDPAVIAEKVAARLTRQERFLADDGPRLVMILDEAAIRRTVGGPQVMHRQLAHLRHLMRRPNIVVQIAPLELGERTPAASSFTLLTMSDGERHLYSESLNSGHFTTDPREINRFSRAYDRLRGSALSVADSAALIRSVMEGLVNPMQRTGAPSLRHLAYFKSASYSDSNGGDCVQPAINLAESHGVVLVRDSKDPNGPVLTVSPTAWAAFAEAAGSGKFGIA
ncbi:Scr1 family TA system antitoxin-like transcriptional regulator [Kitasatospora sp. NPDC048407]|uniref:helix-turn-helix domain-containing protein n=1 Tax=Kitasatospora sp. NPDC048407 TaxID=3364051 RepID=UPI00371CE02B